MHVTGCQGCERLLICPRHCESASILNAVTDSVAERESEIETMFQEITYYAGPWSCEADNWTLARMREQGFHGVSSLYTGNYIPSGEIGISYVFGSCESVDTANGGRSIDWSVLYCRKKSMVQGEDGIYRWTLPH